MRVAALIACLLGVAFDAWAQPPQEADARLVREVALGPRYEALFGGFDPEVAGEIAELHVTNDLTFVQSFNRGRLAPRAGGNAQATAHGASPGSCVIP